MPKKIEKIKKKPEDMSETEESKIKSESEPRKKAAEELEQSMGTVKEIITIIMALAFTNTIIQFFVTTDGGVYTGRDIFRLEYIINWWILFLIITTIIRFHHGNLLHLNKKYSKNELISTNMPNFSPASCLVFFFLEGFIFSLMSVYQSQFGYLSRMFIVLFFIDFLLFACMQSNRIIEAIRSRHHEQIGEMICHVIFLKDAEMRWMVVNGVTTVILLLLWVYTIDWGYFTCVFLVAITINLILDYILNWKYYFPPIPKT